MFFQVRNAAEFSCHIPAPAHAAPNGLWSPQTTLSPNRCRAGRHLKAAVLLPGDIAVPWPRLRPQPTAAVGTRGSGARRFYIITYQARSRNPLSLHRHPDARQHKHLLQAGPLCSPRIYTIHINPKEQGLFCGPGTNLHSPPGRDTWWYPYRWSFANSQTRVADLPVTGRSRAALTPVCREVWVHVGWNCFSHCGSVLKIRKVIS